MKPNAGKDKSKAARRLDFRVCPCILMPNARNNNRFSSKGVFA
jgi:hypothetical protein